MIEAIDEVLEIGKLSGIPIMITHFKIRGKNNWGQAEKLIAKLDMARKSGVDVTMAQYPYTAGSTILHAVIPPWYHTKGPDNLLKILREDREKVKKDIRERMDWENFSGIVGWENIFVSSVETDKNKVCEGKNIVEIAKINGDSDPADTVINLLIQENLAVGMINFGLNEKDIVTIMKDPKVCFITDGLLAGKNPHPRVYGTYPRILGNYVREQKVLMLEEAVRKMTYLPAARLHLKNKGLIKEKMDADITIFNANTIIDKGTYQEPKQYPDGIEYVLVNGELVVDKGEHNGATPGKTIRD